MHKDSKSKKNSTNNWFTSQLRNSEILKEIKKYDDNELKLLDDSRSFELKYQNENKKLNQDLWVQSHHERTSNLIWFAAYGDLINCSKFSSLFQNSVPFIKSTLFELQNYKISTSRSNLHLLFSSTSCCLVKLYMLPKDLVNRLFNLFKSPVINLPCFQSLPMVSLTSLPASLWIEKENAWSNTSKRLNGKPSTNKIFFLKYKIILRQTFIYYYHKNYEYFYKKI